MIRVGIGYDSHRFADGPPAHPRRAARFPFDARAARPLRRRRGRPRGHRRDPRRRRRGRHRRDVSRHRAPVEGRRLARDAAHGAASTSRRRVHADQQVDVTVILERPPPRRLPAGDGRRARRRARHRRRRRQHQGEDQRGDGVHRARRGDRRAWPSRRWRAPDRMRCSTRWPQAPPLARLSLIFLSCVVENLFPPSPSDVFVALAAFLSHQGAIHPVGVFATAWTGGTLGAIGVYYLSPAGTPGDFKPASWGGGSSRRRRSPSSREGVRQVRGVRYCAGDRFSRGSARSWLPYRRPFRPLGAPAR